MARGGKLRLQDILGTGMGGGDIPYDQTDPAAQDVMAGAQQAPPPEAADPYGGANVGPTMGMGSPMDQAGAMGAGPEDMAPTTDMLSDNELAAVDDPSAPDLDQLINSPELTPEDRAMLEQQILMAARRQAAGI